MEENDRTRRKRSALQGARVEKVVEESSKNEITYLCCPQPCTCRRVIGRFDVDGSVI